MALDPVHGPPEHFRVVLLGAAAPERSAQYGLSAKRALLRPHSPAISAMTAIGGSKTWAGSGRAALGRAEAAMSSRSPQGPAATNAGGTKLAGFALARSASTRASLRTSPAVRSFQAAFT